MEHHESGNENYFKLDEKVFRKNVLTFELHTGDKVSFDVFNLQMKLLALQLYTKEQLSKPGKQKELYNKMKGFIGIPDNLGEKEESTVAFIAKQYFIYMRKTEKENESLKKG